MDSTLRLFYWETLSVSDLNAMKIVEFLGAAVKPVQLSRELLDDERMLAQLLPDGGSFVANASTLAELCHRTTGSKSLQHLLRRTRRAFVYGFQRKPGHSKVLQELTAGRVVGIEPFQSEDTRFRVEPSSRYLCGQFAGLSFGRPDHARDSVFAERNEQSGCSSLIRIGQRPCFLSTQQDGCDLFLVACADIADLDVFLPRRTSRLKFFSSLVPLMMFVVSNSPREVWHNNSPRACFIVDDPLLTRRYGFLEYHKLLEVMEYGKFCTSMAFIPWNFRRSEPGITKLFANNSHRYSLCVHGCDHTGAEFGAVDYKLLRAKSQKALDRMTQHRRVSGLAFDDVMVFPQGIFSRAAVEAIKACNYLAAVNSTPYPVDVENALVLRDLLEVAVTRFSNFPMFLRRSPDDLVELAFDLFLGKPALIVEHHGYFKDGYELLAEAVEKVNALDRRLEWCNLATVCSRACLERAAGSRGTEVKFFTNRFSLWNETQQSQNYTLFRRASIGKPAPSLTINGRPIDCSQEQGHLKMEISLNPRQTAEVRIEHRPSEPVGALPREHLLYRTKVFVRRSLSEFRDNYVDKSEFLSKSARNLLGHEKFGSLKSLLRQSS